MCLATDGFAQVFPEHKYLIVECLRDLGYKVGMTGDGVNDAPALKRADVGVAVMGCTDAARAAADIVLTQEGLSTIVKGIVIAGTGAGGMSDPERAAIKALGPLETRPVIVRSNRTGNGRVIPRKEYDAEHMVPADNLNPQKARILLMLALTRTRDLAEIRRMFRDY